MISERYYIYADQFWRPFTWRQRMAQNTCIGTVKRLVTERGFGFIRSNADEREFFFHRSSCVNGTSYDELDEGTQVSFEIESAPKGPRASRVSVLG